MSRELDKMIITINIPLEKFDRVPNMKTLGFFKKFSHLIEDSLKAIFPKVNVLVESVDNQGQKALEC